MDPTLQRLHDRTAKIVVIGQGYVGLPVAMRASQVGFAEVVGFEVSPERVRALQAGTSFVGDVSDEELGETIERGYIATDDPNDLADFDVAAISVPTPLRDGSPDLSFIEQAGATLGAHLRPGACVVLESTTYPGTTTELLGEAAPRAYVPLRGVGQRHQRAHARLRAQPGHLAPQRAAQEPQRLQGASARVGVQAWHERLA